VGSFFTAERAISPVDGSVAFVVVDEAYDIQPEATGLFGMASVIGPLPEH
jgi:hypothetical protein